jgi:hypothetical protein
MKSFVILIALAIIGYWAYTYYQANPNDLPVSLTHHQAGLVSTPIPTPATPTPTPPPAVQPDLASVSVFKGVTMTHAKVREIKPDSLVFGSDQGLFQITYDRLAPGFEAYYLPRMPAPTPVVTPDPNLVPTPTRVPIIHREAQRSAADEANAVLSFNAKVAGLEQKLRELQGYIDKYYIQSNYNNPDAITESQFAGIKAEFDARTAELADLRSRGP